MTGIKKEPGGCATPIGDAMNTEITKEQAEQLAALTQQAGVNAAGWEEFKRQWAVDGMPKDKQRLADAAYKAGMSSAPSPQQQQADHSEDELRMIEIADAERLRLAKKYQLNVDCDTSPMGGNMDWARLEGAVSVVSALRAALANHSEQALDMVQGDDDLVQALETIAKGWVGSDIPEEFCSHGVHGDTHCANCIIGFARQALANYRARKGEPT